MGRSNLGQGRGQTYVIGSSFDLLIEFVLVFVPEGRVAHQQDVEDHAWGRRTTPSPGIT